MLSLRSVPALRGYFADAAAARGLMTFALSTHVWKVAAGLIERIGPATARAALFTAGYLALAVLLIAALPLLANAANAT